MYTIYFGGEFILDIRERLKKSKRVVIKVGTSTITYHENGRLNLKRIQKMAWVISDLVNQGKDVVLVSSGAIGVGSTRLNFTERPKETRKKQAAAAVGQAVLMQIYQNFFNEYNQTVAQILLTKDDVNIDERRHNVENTFRTLFEMGVVPIVNANDTISTDEIEFSDNDRLSALVAQLTSADLLIILTDIDALYDGDPRVNPDAKRISCVEKITDEIMAMAGSNGSKYSVGGMITKLEAAKMCEENNIDMVVAHGENPTIIDDVIDGLDVGTLFIGKH